MLDAIAKACRETFAHCYYIGDMPDDMLAAARSAAKYKGIGLLSAAPDKDSLKKEMMRAGADYIVDSWKANANYPLTRRKTVLIFRSIVQSKTAKDFMIALAYQRVSERFEVQAPVMIEDFRTGFYYNGVIYNYCADGVYLESDYALRPGRNCGSSSTAPWIFLPPELISPRSDGDVAVRRIRPAIHMEPA